MRFAVTGSGDGRGHVDGAFDEFGLPHVQHRRAAPVEFGPREAIAVVEGRDRRAGGRDHRSRHLVRRASKR